MNNYENDQDGVEQAVTGLLRAMAKAMPFIASCVGFGLLVNIALSAPFAVSCKTVEVRRAPTAVEVPITDSKDEAIAVPKHQAEE